MLKAASADGGGADLRVPERGHVHAGPHQRVSALRGALTAHVQPWGAGEKAGAPAGTSQPGICAPVQACGQPTSKTTTTYQGIAAHGHIEGRSMYDHMTALVRPSTCVQQVFGDATLGGAEELAAAVGIIFLSVKPQYLDSILQALQPHLAERHLIVSIAAGVRIASLEANLPEGARVVSHPA